MKSLCASCNVCVGLSMPEQSEPRHIAGADKDAPILVIDNHEGDKKFPLEALRYIFGKTPYTYTHTVRCHFDSKETSLNDFLDAANRCAVWTNLLIPNRSIILTTLIGFQQMALKGEWEDGKIFNSPAHGYILCIASLHLTTLDDWKHYKVKLERICSALKTGAKV